jgi:hypothetical protein
MQKAYVELVHLWQLLAKLVPLLCALADAEHLISELKAEMQIDTTVLGSVGAVRPRLTCRCSC